MKAINLSYNVPIIFESLEGSEEFVIQGIAINSKVTDNNHKFLSEELRVAAGSLSNKPLLKDHDNSTDSIVGRVIFAEFDETTESIKFKAKINQTEQGKKIRELIKSGDLNTVSIGANVKSIDEEEGLLVPRGISFKELSVVAVPADSDATFTYRGGDFNLALREAYNTVKEEAIKCEVCGEMIEKDKMETHMKEKHPKEEESNLPSLEENTNKKEENMEKDETIQTSNEFSEKLDALSKVVETLLSEFSQFKTEVSEKLKANVEEKPEVAVEAAPIESAEPAIAEKVEEKVIEKEDETEEAEETEEDEDIDLDEKNNYKIVQRHKSFTIERKYR